MESDLAKIDKRNLHLYEYSEKYIPMIWLEKAGFGGVDRDRIMRIFFIYLIPFFLGGVNLAIAFFAGGYVDRSLLYLTYIIIIVTGAWSGGVAGGVITSLLTIIGNYLISRYITGAGADSLFFVHSAILLLNSVIVSYIIALSKKSDEVSFLKEKERIYARTFHEIYDEYTKALNEIKARDQFLSIASHELKTPLTSMLLKLSDMLNRIRNVSLAHFSVPELMQVLQNAQDQIKWLSAMINDLLNVSLMTTGKINLDRQRTDLSEITRSVRENFSEVLKKEGYSVSIDAPKPVMGFWDKTRLEQAVTNLFSNAIKYGKNRPIKIAVANHGKTAKFIIQDRGIGISHNDKKILFKPFERPKAVQGYKKGLGVGLYLTHMIIQSHGGNIKVNSRLEQGTTFIVELPANGLPA